MDMLYDKKNGNVAFREKDHKYFNLNDINKKYTSVTTLIHSYAQEFNSDFFSSYEALKKILNQEDFKKEKIKLLETKKVDIENLSKKYNFNIEDFNKIKQEILLDWEIKNKLACERGTLIHSKLENDSYTDPTTVATKFGLGGKFISKRDYTELDIENGLYPEYLIYDDSCGLAGQIDLLIKKGNDITIVDFKTNKELKFESGYDFNTKKKATMKFPLNNLMDCNMSHYTLQLSTYAYMLQKINPNFIINKLIIEHHDHDGNIKSYPVKYLKNEVKMMINHFIKQQEKEERKNRRKPIIF